jgi:hypothetical protein
VRRVGIILLFTLLLVPSLYASNRYDPRLRFRTLTTPRFDIYFHQGEDALARRLAGIAESVATELEPRLGRPRARVHVILVDQTDLSNGWATPLPYNLIEILAATPRAESMIGNTSDWLRLVFTHEYAHVLHLERSRGVLGAVGRVFGRNPFFYPNLVLPPWQIEGLATYHESTSPGSRDGRLNAGDFGMLARRAAGSGRFPRLDRASNNVVHWPGGTSPYLYGGFFHQFLAERYGEASLTRLADATAGRLPFLGSPAFKKVFGKSLGSLWADFERETARGSTADATAPQRLTRHGFTVEDPWYVNGALVYSMAGPHEFPAIVRWSPGGPERLATRYAGEQIGASSNGLMVFDQVEYVQSVALQSDLYARDLAGGGVRRLTREARAADPDVAADGTIVCVIQTPAGRALATMAVPAAGRYGTPAIISRDAADYASPRWSPDGTAVVVERRTTGGPSEIVVIDPRSGRTQRLVTVTPRGRNTSPVWSRDGQTIYFASDRDGGPFQIYAAILASGAIRRLENAGDSAQSPAVSPDGATLVFVGYTPAGYDLFSIALSEAKWQSVENSQRTSDPEPEPNSTFSIQHSAVPSAYSPWATLLPRFWTPVIEEDGDALAFGAATAGADALGRHSYFATAAWSTRGRPDWSAGYAYDRWRPTLFVDASDDQDPFQEGDIRVREVNAGALLSFRTVRRTQTIAGAFHAAHEEIDCGACEDPFSGDADRRALRAGWLFDTSRSFGYSISDEEGANISLSAEWTGEPLGADGDATALVGDVRGYLRAGPRHAVIAGRVAAAHSTGDESVRRVFGAGGSSAGLPLLDFDFGAIGLVRGFDSSDVSGRSTVVANLDYRLPLAWIERGSGTWPFFLRSLHGALFADVGSAWDRHRTSDDVRASFGAELSADVVVGFSLPVTLTGGVAIRHDPSGRADGPAVFARIGRAF